MFKNVQKIKDTEIDVVNQINIQIMQNIDNVDNGEFVYQICCNLNFQ